MKDTKNVYSQIIHQISTCASEEELERVSDLSEECHTVGAITEEEYRSIEEELDDRLMTLVESGAV